MADGGDLTKYISNNNSVLNSSNYNEIDALIFAEISYLRFEDLPGYPDNNYNSIKEFAEVFLKSNCNCTADQKEMLTALAKSDRYSKCSIGNFAAEKNTSQWAAATINIDNDNSVIAMRGTDGTELGWTEDFELGYELNGTEAQKLSAEYLKKSNANNIFLTGHSKGGNDVISAFVQSDKSIRDKVLRIDNFDGPGVNGNYALINGTGYLELNEKLYNYYPENSVIGQLLLDNPGHNKFFHCDTAGHTEIPILGEHDPFSFKIDSNGYSFNECEQSLLSKYIDNVLDDTLIMLNPVQQKQFIQTLIRLGIPAIIANNMDLSYFNKEYFSKINFDTVRDFNNLPQVLSSFLMSLFIGGAQTGLEEFVDVMSDSFDKVLNQISDFGEKIYNGVSDIYNKTCDAAEDTWNSFVSWISGIGNKDSSKNSSNENHNCGGDREQNVQATDLMCSPDRMHEFADILLSLSKEISEQRNMVNSAQHSLAIGTSVIKYLKLEKYENNIITLSNKLVNMAHTLEDVSQKYLLTEEQISAICGE